jgi:hypothetical protein
MLLALTPKNWCRCLCEFDLEVVPVLATGGGSASAWKDAGAVVNCVAVSRYRLGVPSVVLSRRAKRATRRLLRDSGSVWVERMS